MGPLERSDRPSAGSSPCDLGSGLLGDLKRSFKGIYKGFLKGMVVLCFRGLVFWGLGVWGFRVLGFRV